jgi:hypothetical protein
VFYVVTYIFKEQVQVEDVARLFENTMECRSIGLRGFAAMRLAKPLRGIVFFVQADKELEFADFQLQLGKKAQIGLCRHVLCSSFRRNVALFSKELQVRHTVPLVRQYDAAASGWVQALLESL